MIIFNEAASDADKAIVSAFKHYGYNSQAHDRLIIEFIDRIVNVYKGKYTKEDLITAFNRMYKRNVSLLDKGVITTKRSALGSSGISNMAVQDSNPASYEASPNIIQRLYNPRPKMILWGGYQLNKYEQDIVNFINTNNHSKMDAIRNKPAFSNLSNKLIKNAPIQKILYRKEDSIRVNKVGDVVSFDLRSFSANPYNLMMTKFTKGQSQ
ncbi:MAG: hypothetical protein LBB68_05450, partial [Treponema sp.]|nr:hypothetical protein [Treponema sp.]